MAVIYNVVRGDGVFFEGMTKEQIFELLAEYTGQTVQDIDQAFITKLKEVNKGNSIRLWLGTTAEYNAIQTKEDDVLYICTDDTFVQDTGIELTKLSDRIDSNYQATMENLDKKEQDYQELVEQFEAISQNTLHIVDKGSHTFTADNMYNAEPWNMPSINVGEIGKIEWDCVGEGIFPLTNGRTYGGMKLPSSGIYLVVIYASRRGVWSGDSDGSMGTSENYTDVFSKYAGSVFLESGTGNASYYGGNGYVFYMRLL